MLPPAAKLIWIKASRPMLRAHACAIGVAAITLFVGPAAAAPRDAHVPGGIAIVRVAPARAPAPQVFYEGRPVLVQRHDGAWHAVIGLALHTRPGIHRVQIVAAGAGGVEERDAAFRVMPHAYPVQRLTIRDASKVTPPPEALERIEREQQTMAELRTRFRDIEGVDTRLSLPARGRLSSRFGLRRVLNGEPRDPHGGLDLALREGTPVGASAPGIVLDADDYYYCGKSVFIDHGQGLISLYCHLQRIDVAPGQSVRRGQRIGLSGMSGRATGPHLHWSVYLNGNAVNPELLLAPRPTRSRAAR